MRAALPQLSDTFHGVMLMDKVGLFIKHEDEDVWGS
jgi:hypothetical protein